jgi:hypothetical protein
MRAIKLEQEIDARFKQMSEGFETQLIKFEEKLERKAERCDLESVKANILQLEEKLSKMASDISVTNDKIALARTEDHEKSKRKTNIVIRGLPEGTDDLALTKELLNMITVEVNVTATTRLGKRRDTPRPLRVVLESEEAKWSVLREAPKVRKVKTKKFDSAKIFLTPDQTKLEREADIKLRRELKEIRNQNPNEKFTIRRGKIVKAEEQKVVPPNPM